MLTTTNDPMQPKYCETCQGLISGAFSGTIKICQCNPEVTEYTLLDFGVHRGTPIKDVPAWYLTGLYDKGKVFGRLKGYLDKNIEGIRGDLKNKGK